MTRWCVLVLFATGCLDSVVRDSCADGYTAKRGVCVAPDAGATGTDAQSPMGGISIGDPHPSCGASMTDPDNCGRCGNVCPTGICTSGACVGTVAGHVVAIGHDYSRYHLAAARVLGNAIALGASDPVRVGWWRGTATDASANGAMAAASLALGQIGRAASFRLIASASPDVIADIDVIVIEAQTGSGETAQARGREWASPLPGFLQDGGVVVVLEGAGGVSYQLARSAGLYDVPAPVTITNQQLNVAAAGDAITANVPSPYLAETSSVAFPGVPGVITDASDDAVVFHRVY